MANRVKTFNKNIKMLQREHTKRVKYRYLEHSLLNLFLEEENEISEEIG